jgi:ubiquitin carboxyl-terminal hydrolase 4/11/15
LTLNQCLGFASEPEILDEQNKWFCAQCRTHVRAKKESEIWSVPEILIIQLKRFSRGEFGQSKIDATVDFPDVLDMAPYVVGSGSPGSIRYDLYAVSEHSGGLSGGHYTAHALVRSGNEKGEWYHFNDSSVTKASRQSAHSSLAYILFYKRALQAATRSEDESDSSN